MPPEEVMVLQGIWDSPSNLRYDEHPEVDRDGLLERTFIGPGGYVVHVAGEIPTCRANS